MTTNHSEQKKKISILGCGWYGLALAKKLIENGFTVNGSTTSSNKLTLLNEVGIKPFLINLSEKEIAYDADFFNCAILCIAIPPKSNSPELDSFITKIDAIALAAEKARVEQIIFISSTGVYQDGNFIVDETIIPEPQTASGKTLLQAENILKSNPSFTTTIIRFGGLIGPNRNLAKHFAGKKDISNGLAPINLIHLSDCIGLTEAIINQEAFGKTYHGVTPHHPSRKEFYTQACIASGFEEPYFIDELLDWKQIDSINVPTILAYNYEVKNWLEYGKVKH
ncbi:NAD(P)H-binding protein [Pedobacter boryungensis]|uniref:NAD(P)H-binding protein n=1 Tax=Pedobacter boryungensis TaxID=869962 RepID=A0ABX2DCF7_9SPHI|nr:NAD(P)H-binding protein [Pedobacter boryungensis]NQX31773.1 NAD(P)H-binding protein [Pedobacter boryungensis]